MKFYRYTFADGYYCFCGKMTKIELQHEELKHGKLVEKTLA